MVLFTQTSKMILKIPYKWHQQLPRTSELFASAATEGSPRSPRSRELHSTKEFLLASTGQGALKWTHTQRHALSPSCQELFHICLSFLHPFFKRNGSTLTYDDPIYPSSFVSLHHPNSFLSTFKFPIFPPVLGSFPSSSCRAHTERHHIKKMHLLWMARLLV